MEKEIDEAMQKIYNIILEIRLSISDERKKQNKSSEMFTNVCIEMIEENFNQLDLLLKK